MSTQLEEHGTHWVVKTIDAPGKRRRFGRLAVAVPKGDAQALRAEIIKQADAARERAGVHQTPQEPVV